ncbi:MAG: DEAD/DEAH box helicase [Polyangiaceae bacterium]
MPDPPWKFETGVASVVDRWVSEGSVRPCLTADKTLAAASGEFAPIPDELAPEVRRALTKRGIAEVYSHQAQAFYAATRARNVTVATPTASGKSLCFNLPVLDAIARDREARALYLYPTKALARDQEAAMREMLSDAQLGAPAIVYDGDTPGDARRAARERTSIVMTNPDMLHAGILPHHASWARLFSNIKYVVLDELHTYRGVFGSHVAHVLDRLRRVARFHGSNPTFLCATATIGNPREHTARILGVDPSEIELVDESGAPRGERRVFVYNPPVVNAELGVRASYLKSAVRLATDLLRARVPTILFGPSRNSVEIMLKYLRDALASELDEGAIMAYRGGYLPDTRRRIERGLREGDILGVVATNALELGIDIGDLDAVICASYPGSVAATWQRFGRAGRRGKLSIAVMVAASHALDQYLATHPDVLLDGAIEQARIDPGNTEIVIQHLKCAAFELPFVDGESYGKLDPPETRQALEFLAGHGVVHEENGRFFWSTDKYPANHVSLRSVSWDNTVIIDVATGKTLAELDWRATPVMLHEQAIYQHDGEQYQVERLDHENHKAFVRRVVPDYFTTALTHRKVAPLDTSSERPLFGDASAGGPPWGFATTAVLGEVSVVTKVVGFKKIKFFTHENTGYGDVRLPDVDMHTTSFWWTIPAWLCLEPGFGRAAALDGLRGILRALETVATIALMCEPRDLGQAIEDGCLGAPDVGSPGELVTPRGSKARSPAPEAGMFDPTLFLFDSIPGGVGLAPRIFEQAESLIVRARSLLERCTCEGGCPSCTGAVDAAVQLDAIARSASRKRVARAILDLIIGELA